MDKIERYDDSLRKKNYHVLEIENKMNDFEDLEVYKEQFKFGAKNIWGEYFNKRPYELTKDEYKIWMDKVFKTFDTIDTTLQLKEATGLKVMQVIDTNRRHTGDDYNDEKDITLSIFENLTDRRSDINKVYKSFFLRYLSPKTRETIWKGILLDQQEVKNYEDNIKYDKSFTVSKDEIYMLKIIQGLWKDKFHNFGNDYDMIILLKAVMIYTAAYLNTYLQDFHYYMLFPLLHAFKSYRTYTRAKMLISFYITVLRTRMLIVDEVDDRDAAAYETYINYIIDKLLEHWGDVDPNLRTKLEDLLSIEDNEIKTFHMDLLSSVRGNDHISNLDLRISKQKVIFGELLRSFLERWSVGFVDVRTTWVIWDFILVKNNKSKDDLFIAFALLLNMIKQDVLDSENIIQLEKVLREKARLIDDYDFFCELFEFGKERDWKPAFSLSNGDSLRQNFVSLDRVRQELEQQKKLKEKEEAQKQRWYHSKKYEEQKTVQSQRLPTIPQSSRLPSYPVNTPGTKQPLDSRNTLMNPPTSGLAAQHTKPMMPVSRGGYMPSTAQNMGTGMNNDNNQPTIEQNKNWYKPDLGGSRTKF